MKTILILGGLGMLGNSVGKYFQALSEKYDVYLTARDTSLAYGKRSNWIKYDPTGKTVDASTNILDVFEQMPRNPDYVISAIGAIKPMFKKSMHDSIYVNALLPHQLATTCKQLNIRFFQISTDCVYSGRKGNYIESDLHDALDDYGKSKSLGEPVSHSMVLRTSIIGPEIKDYVSLIAWAQSQAGNRVNGFKNHLWSGVTCKQYASICDQIISKDLYEEGLFHVHSNVVSKYELLTLISERYQLGLKIEEVDAPEAIDRSIVTEKSLMSRLSVPALRDQIMDL